MSAPWFWLLVSTIVGCWLAALVLVAAWFYRDLSQPKVTRAERNGIARVIPIRHDLNSGRQPAADTPMTFDRERLG